jgi:molybdate transport system substrate-binding protein
MRRRVTKQSSKRLPRRLALFVLASLASGTVWAAGGGTDVTQRAVLIFAAASMREACTELERPFEAANPGVRLRFNFAGSQELRTQLEQGAPADVFISADLKQMEGAAKAGLVGPQQLLVTNKPVLIVPKANPAGLKRFMDLPNVKRLVIGTPEVPIGHYTLLLLDKATANLGNDFRARVEARVVSRELNVKQVLAKVVLGEADAGIVYASDASGAEGQVLVVPIPVEFNVVAQYPMAVVKRAPHPEVASAYVRYLASPEAQAVFARYGFGPP